MKFLVIAATLCISFAIASPAESSEERNLFARAKPKLNQYRTLNDCKNDKNILYHAAPSAGNCYDLDDKTGAFFYNTAGFLFSSANKDIGCNGDSIRLRGGQCMEKGSFKSVVFR